MPSPSTSAPPTTTPAGTPSPTPPPQPAASRDDTPAGAEAFARYWLTALDYAYKSGDTKPFRALGACPSCESLASGIEKYYSTGGRFEGGTFAADDVKTTRHVGGSAALVDLVYSRSAGQAIPSAGPARVVAAESGTEFLITLERASQRWRVSSVKTVER